MIKFQIEGGEESQGQEEEKQLLPKGQMSHNKPTPDQL
jgi:hypothetical protein